MLRRAHAVRAHVAQVRMLTALLQLALPVPALSQSLQCHAEQATHYAKADPYGVKYPAWKDCAMHLT